MLSPLEDARYFPLPKWMAKPPRSVKCSHKCGPVLFWLNDISE
jgi:hypothetical protein